MVELSKVPPEEACVAGARQAGNDGIAAVQAAYPIIRDALLNEMMSKEYFVANDVKARVRAETIEEVVKRLREPTASANDTLDRNRVADFIERELK